LSQLDRRQALKTLATLGAASAAAPLLSACNRSTASVSVNEVLPPVKIGFLYPQTGVLKSDGDDLGKGFQLYVKLNGGKLGGRVADVVTADEGDNPATGKAALDKLLRQDKVLTVTGVVSSAVMTAIRDTVEAAKIPLVGSNASPSSLHGVKYIWRTSWGSSDPGLALGKYVADHVNGTVAMMGPDYQAGHDFLDGFKETYLAAGGEIQGQPFYTPFVPTPSTNFLPILTQIKNSAAKAMFCFYAGSLAVAFVKQYRQVGLPQTLYAQGSLTEGGVLLSEGGDAAGIFTAMNYSADLDNAANRRFASEYQKAYNLAPSTFSMAAFDAATVLDKAITLAGRDLTPESLNQSIAKVGQIDSPRGGWEFSPNHTPLQKWYLRQVRMDGPLLTNVVLGELTTL
jgi:branched-chain amino acid transport system substrate-binding protein